MNDEKKSHAARFFASIGDVENRTIIVDRLDVRTVLDPLVSQIDGLRHEEVTVTIRLLSSGNTTAISDNEIVAWILSKINC